jgi:hypothetical protein
LEKKSRRGREQCGVVGEATVLVGSVPCRLLTGDVQPEKHTVDYHEEEKVLHVPRNMHGDRANRPRLVSIEGREIVGPGFSTEPKACVEQPVKETQEKMRQPGPIGKTIAPGTVPKPRWYPPGLTCMQIRRVKKLRARELQEKAREAERDHWFNQERPMKESAKTWKEKQIEKEERGEDFRSDNEYQGKEDPPHAEINMVFELPREFHLPKETTTQLDLGAERAILEKPDALEQHVRPPYIKGHLDGTLVNRMLVDGGACVNIMPWSLFRKLGHKEEELLKKNMMLSGFSGDASDAKGIISMKLTTGSKTVPATFFVVDVKGRYNVLLGRDWIHANGCVPSTC